MNLQIACDMTDIDLMWKVLDATYDLIDIIELGNIGQYEGARIIPMVREKYPNCEIMWDQKQSMLYTDVPAFESGADYVSVDSRSTYETFQQHFAMREKYGSKIVCDMIGDFEGPTKAIYAEKIGCDQISFHPNLDHDAYPVGDVKRLKYIKDAVDKIEVSTYGGFTLENVRPVLECKPDVLVVGAAIWKAEDPRAVTLKFRELMKEYE